MSDGSASQPAGPRESRAAQGHFSPAAANWAR